MIDQANWSFRFILGILIMMLVYMFSTFSSEDEQIFQVIVMFPVITLLLGGYTFTYRGKEHLTSRIMFYVFLGLSLLAIWAFIYMIEMAKAFAH